MSRVARLALALVLPALALATAAAPARGHDFSIITSFDCVGSGELCPQSTNHDDEDPFKGWAYLTVTNSGTEAWDDFHFELFEVSDPIDNVFFVVSAPNQPTSSQSGLSWVLSDGGHTLDLFFESDPLLPTETATFAVYTDNTIDQVPVFGTLYYPTAVPEPGTFLLLGTAFVGIAAFRRLAAKAA